MRVKNKTLVLAAAAVWAMVLTGCGERVVETEAPQTEAKTEAVTEAVIQKVTEAPIVVQTEPPTEKQTEPPTEKQTEPKILTPAEEEAQEKLYESYQTKFANDAVNIRTSPDRDADNVISSYDKFDEVTVIGETPSWYKILNGGEEGYVRKEFLSNTYEEAASAVEVANIPSTAPSETTAMAESSDENTQQSAPAVVNAEVSGYADSFPIVVASDANLRQSPNENADVIDVINANTQVTALGESGEWYQVDFNGNVGYVNKNLVG